ncbi:MAG: acyltransferase [Verrucomicrobia bacterium]|nr:acyltransferase [Verrucomicrobiota bacterium]
MQKHVPELDGIRGLAILMVLFWHYYCGQLPRALATSGWTGVLIRAASSFWSGVDLFFVLSGFLIGGILIDNRDVLNLYKVFYIRRACRILPVCVLTLAAFFTLRPVLDPDRTTWLFRHAMPDWSYLTFTQNIVMGIRNSFGAHFLGITWSLAIEEQFYLFLPFLLFVLGYRRMVLILAPLVIGAIMLRLLFPGFGAFVNMPFRMDALILGVILAVAVRHPPVVRLLRENRVRLRIVVGILGAAWILVTATQPALGAFKGSFYAAVYAGLILLVVLETGQGWCAPLRSRPLRFCGTISYGLYMYHQAVTGLLHAFICKSKPLLIRPLAWGVTALSVVVVFLLAALSFYYFEQRFLRWGHGFKYSRAASLPDGRRLVDDFRPEAGGGHDG